MTSATKVGRRMGRERGGGEGGRGEGAKRWWKEGRGVGKKDGMTALAATAL